MFFTKLVRYLAIISSKKKKKSLHLSIACWASLVIQMVKNSPAMRETCVQFLGWEDPLEEGMAIHCRILAWRIPGTEEPDRLHGVPKSRTQLGD